MRANRAETDNDDDDDDDDDDDIHHSPSAVTTATPANCRRMSSHGGSVKSSQLSHSTRVTVCRKVESRSAFGTQCGMAAEKRLPTSTRDDLARARSP